MIKNYSEPNGKCEENVNVCVYRKATGWPDQSPDDRVGLHGATNPEQERWEGRIRARILAEILETPFSFWEQVELRSSVTPYRQSKLMLLLTLMARLSIPDPSSPSLLIIIIICYFEF